MQEEIKEILDRAKNLKYKCCEEIAPGTYVMKDGKQTDNLIEAIYIIEKLLDCITNLQEKVDQYENPEDMTLFYMWLDEKAKDKMKELQEENERLQQENFNIRENIHIEKISLPEELIKNKSFMELYDIPSYEDYKSRNEKAIEYIEENKQLSRFADLRKDGVHNYDLECDADDLINILQGKEK